MLDEKAIKLLFFAIVEPTNPFWLSEINSHGVVRVYERITKKNYYEKITGYLKIKEQLASLQISKLQADLLAANSSFITSEDNDWPSQLNDLAAPPVGLVIRGDRKVLQNLNNSIPRHTAQPLKQRGKRFQCLPVDLTSHTQLRIRSSLIKLISRDY